MSVATPTTNMLQDQHDVNVTVGAGVDTYALTWDNASARFVLTAHATAADPHTQYALLAGRAGGQTLYGGTAANDDITIHGTSDGTRDTSYVLLQPTAGNVGIGTTAPATALHVVGAATIATDATGFWRPLAMLNAHATSVPYMLIGKEESNDNCLGITWNTQYQYGAISVYGQTNTIALDKYGSVGIGTASPATLLHAVSTTATTNALRNVLTLGANVTDAGVGAAGLGGAILFQAETSTTVDSDMAQIAALWTTATHATKASALTFSTLTAGGALTERVRIDGAGNVGINDTAPAEALDVTGNINTTGVVKVDDVQVLSNRVIDARAAATPDSGDATTDGLIDALRDAMIAHGLIAAA